MAAAEFILFYVDHLGTATFVTNSQGEATQFFLNLLFGETMLKQMDGSYNNPFKFDAKEFDEDTGLYYYGARYYNLTLARASSSCLTNNIKIIVIAMIFIINI
ncbi:RHS repeat domain-containing protein [Chryseobacterium sp. KMC2]|uniref:RHS repeat domain-containing protein n=1 Tax=Chryseobacterium sp. KMC2 TaxID=2800705 RepID=UPI0019228531|nr:RHS repeat-associated core domain-containing protein [Chryseobacterium sp. KMC2]MBL3547999.1 hypothetical protein [Chryseobacterium sp. KMC2]